MKLVLQAFFILIVGLILLRFSGRKSISRMTFPQTVVMFSIGTLLVQPIAQKGIGRTIMVVSVFIVTLILLEYLQVKGDWLEKFFTGKSRVVIQNGELNVSELRKLRMTVDQLEMRLRTSGISKIEDVKTATIEANGQLGYELAEEAKPLTVGEFKKIMSMYKEENRRQFSQINNGSEGNDGNIFAEMTSEQREHPKYIQ